MKTFLLALLAFATVSSAFLLPRSGSAQDASHRIAVVAKRFEFSPGDVTVKKGVPITLALTSQDADHGLKFKELNVNISAKKGHTSEVTFTPDKVGTFTGQCSVFCGSGHGSMRLTLHVTE
ncbi:MAG: cupredoxin domain-containing protein [Acidobacteriota bacterium]